MNRRWERERDWERGREKRTGRDQRIGSIKKVRIGEKKMNSIVLFIVTMHHVPWHISTNTQYSVPLRRFITSWGTGNHITSYAQAVISYLVRFPVSCLPSSILELFQIVFSLSRIEFLASKSKKTFVELSSPKCIGTAARCPEYRNWIGKWRVEWMDSLVFSSFNPLKIPSELNDLLAVTKCSDPRPFCQ